MKELSNTDEAELKKNLGYEKTCSSASLLRRGFDKIFENAEYL